MNLQDILSEKGTNVFTTLPESSLAQVARFMIENRVGSLVVCQRDLTSGESLIGIITERDLLRCCSEGRLAFSDITVSEVMTTELITASPNDSVGDLMGVMTTNRIRHVPVLSNGRLVGMVSIGDLIKAQHDHLAKENHFMRDYIQS